MKSQFEAIFCVVFLFNFCGVLGVPRGVSPRIGCAYCTGLVKGIDIRMPLPFESLLT